MKSNFELPKKESFAHLPTPIHFLPRISAELGVEVFLKRDDFTGLEWSGNKVRKLEYLFHEAKNKGATCVITCGGVQSNHCRATAALAAREGLQCILLLRGEEPKSFQANFLLDKLFGAQIFYLTNEQYYNQNDLLITIDTQVRQTGGTAYFIPEGGSNAMGSMGYISAWNEIISQLKVEDAAYSSVVVAHGSGGTQAGLILGKILQPEAPLAHTRVVAVNVCYDKQTSYNLVKDILWSAIQKFHLPISFFADDIEILDGFVGVGYAQNTKAELEFIARIARTEGVLLDSTYTGKAFYGLYQTVKKNKDALGKKILFLHTGGAFGNFKMEKEWREIL